MGTPLENRLEPENDLFEKENHLNQTNLHFLGFKRSILGVYFIAWRITYHLPSKTANGQCYNALSKNLSLGDVIWWARISQVSGVLFFGGVLVV